MLDMAFIQREAPRVKEAIRAKNIPLDLEDFLSRYEELKALKAQMETLRAKRNAVAKTMKTSPSLEKRQGLVEEGRAIKGEMEALSPALERAQREFQEYAHLIPAIPSPEAPVGEGPEDNVEVRRSGTIPNFSFEPLDHVALLEKNNWAEFERTAKVCGTRSYALKNEMLLLEMAIHRWALDILRAKGMELVEMPSLVRRRALLATGHFPTGEDQVYALQDKDLYLSGTAEVQLNSLHGGEILREEGLADSLRRVRPLL